MSKEVAGYLFARVDMNFDTYKQLKEEHEITLLKVYDKRDRELYKENEEWNSLKEQLSFYIQKKDELESEIRNNNEIK